MKEAQAKKAAQIFRAEGWDVWAQQSPIGRVEWELRGRDVGGGKPVFGFTASDMVLLTRGGRVARIEEGCNAVD